MWWKKWEKKKPESAMTEDERYEQMLRMPAEEKAEVIRRMTRPSLDNAKKMITASGQKPEEYTPLTHVCMAALIYGMLTATSMENLGYYEWRWTRSIMAVVAYEYLGMDIESSGVMAKYMFDSFDETGPEYDANVAQLVHKGIDAYFCLDRPEYLAEGVHQILQAYSEAFGRGEIR